jgi:hypothetical protein
LFAANNSIESEFVVLFNKTASTDNDCVLANKVAELLDSGIYVDKAWGDVACAKLRLNVSENEGAQGATDKEKQQWMMRKFLLSDIVIAVEEVRATNMHSTQN